MATHVQFTWRLAPYPWKSDVKVAGFLTAKVQDSEVPRSFVVCTRETVNSLTYVLQSWLLKMLMFRLRGFLS